MLALAAKQGINTGTVKTCLDNGEMKDLVAKKFSAGQTVFGVTGTPGNIIINNTTGEYTLVSGAVPTSSFEQVINSILN